MQANCTLLQSFGCVLAHVALQMFAMWIGRNINLHYELGFDFFIFGSSESILTGIQLN